MFRTPAQGGLTLNAILSEPETPEPESREQSTERQLRQCRRMAELAMQLAEAAARRMAMPRDAAEKSRGPDPAVTFARLSATIRQSIKLEMQLTAPPKAPRHRTPARKAEPRPPAPPPEPEQYEAPPRTEWPFLKEYAATPPVEAPHIEPAPDTPVQTAVSGGKTISPAFRPAAAACGVPPPPPAPVAPVWTPPPPQRRATDPPRPTGPNWASLFER